jgi:hypothetical protein
MEIPCSAFLILKYIFGFKSKEAGDCISRLFVVIYPPGFNPTIMSAEFRRLYPESPQVAQ